MMAEAGRRLGKHTSVVEKEEEEEEERYNRDHQEHQQQHQGEEGGEGNQRQELEREWHGVERDSFDWDACAVDNDQDRNTCENDASDEELPRALAPVPMSLR